MKNSSLFLLINTLSGMGYSLAAPLFPSLGNGEVLTEDILGWIISTYSLAGTILTPFVPYLTNRYNRITLLIISTFLLAACTLLYGFLNYLDNNYYALIIIIFVLRTIHGVCSAIIGVLVYSLTISLTDESEIQLALGNLEIGWSIGTCSGPLFAGFLYGFGGYSLPFILLGFVLFVSVYLAYQIHSDRLLDQDANKQNPSFIRFLKYPKIFLILLGFIVVQILASFYFPCLVNHLRENFSLSTSASSVFFVIPIASYILILQYLDYLTAKFGIYSIYSFGLITCSLSPIFLYPCPPFPKRIVVLITGFLLNGVGQAPVFIPGLVDLSKNISSIEENIDEFIANDIASAVNTLTIYTGEFVGPIIGGFLTTKYDFKYCCYLVFLIGAAFTVLFIGYFSKNIKTEIENFINSKDNDVKSVSNESSFRESLIDNKIMVKSFQMQSEYSWNFKIEVPSSRRNYTIKKRNQIGGGNLMLYTSLVSNNNIN